MTTDATLASRRTRHAANSYGTSRITPRRRSAASGDDGRVRFPDVLGRPVDLADPPHFRIVDELTANHVLTIDEDDRALLGGDLGKGRLPVHAQIVEAEPPLRVHVIEICLE